MGEIDGPKFSVNQINFGNMQKQASETKQDEPSQEELPQLKDFSDGKAEIIGRSMLFKGNDNINGDLKTLIDNPQIAESSDEIFETAYAAAKASGMENPYEEAASASTVSFQ